MSDHHAKLSPEVREALELALTALTDGISEIPTSMLSKKNAALRVKAKHAIRVLLMEDDHANMEVKDHS